MKSEITRRGFDPRSHEEVSNWAERIEKQSAGTIYFEVSPSTRDKRHLSVRLLQRVVTGQVFGQEVMRGNARSVRDYLKGFSEGIDYIWFHAKRQA